MPIPLTEQRLIASVRATITAHGMIHRGDGVVVAVSGGPDSVALLTVLDRLKPVMDFWMIVAHVDHKLRPDSREDADFVRELGDRLGVRVEVKEVDVREAAAAQDVSIEEAGRRVRYEFFEEVRTRTKADTIATAHQMDDRLETFFLRLFRGTTLTGLGGIPAVRGRLIRPLIESSKQEILQFLHEEKISYRVDQSNLEVNTDRNFIRNSLFPLIADRFASFHKPLLRTMEMVRQEEELLSELASELYSGAVRANSKQLILDAKVLRAARPILGARAIVRALYALSGPEQRWTQVHVDTVMKVIQGDNPSARVNLPGGIVLFREYDRIRLLMDRPEAAPSCRAVVVTGPSEIEIPSVGMILRFRILEPSKEDRFVSAPSHVAYFDADAVGFPFELRPARPGERFRPWGSSGTRKVKKILIDHKVPVRLRRKLPLLIKEGEILWIPGIRRGRGAAVGPSTRRVLEVSIVERREIPGSST